MISALFRVLLPLMAAAQTSAMSPALQATGIATPSFEVASIRMVDTQTAVDLLRGAGLFSMSSYPTARFFMRNTTLDFLVAEAYGIDMQSIQNDRGWMDAQLYDIDARVDGDRPLSHEEIRPLLRNLLDQRFHLAVHRTSRLVSGFNLVIAKSGPRLKQAKEGGQTHGQILPNRIDAQSISATMLASFLARPAGKPVVDRTGLTGSYDIALSYAAANDTDSALPSFFTAIQDQLGLKLEPALVSVEYLVVDHAERVPAEN